jgi:hypothetical protein
MLALGGLERVLLATRCLTLPNVDHKFTTCLQIFFLSNNRLVIRPFWHNLTHTIKLNKFRIRNHARSIVEESQGHPVSSRQRPHGVLLLGQRRATQREIQLP